ncbi:Bud-site selection protein [Phlebopus sp. FC_14]|nr:Bud-site selection protein [Phlebopus sp. FC_14]
MPRGIKRKRPQTIEEDNSNQYHGARLVRKAAKRSKTFEMQKMLKKLREARREDTASEVTKDLESQVDALKQIDSDKAANSALLTKIRKDKVLSNDPQVQSAVSTELAVNLVPPGTAGTPVAKAQSRLLSSKVLASQVSAVVEALRDLLHSPPKTGEYEETEHLDDSGPSKIAKRQPSQARREETRRTREEISQSNTSELHLESDRASISGEGSNDSVDADGWESGTVSDGASSVGGDWESGSILGSSHAEERGDVPSDPDSDTSSSRPVSFKSKAHPASSKGQSEFLPSLSVGFARGDSDSEFSDSEAKAADGIKKNRRGQRARRAIWEKKFGKNANHVKRQREIAQPSNSKWQRLRAPSGDERPHRKYPTQSQSQPSDRHQRAHRQRPLLPQSAEGWSRQSSKVPMRRNKSGADSRRAKWDEQPLHPSWEAKKQKTASIVPSQGTKIVFS